MRLIGKLFTTVLILIFLIILLAYLALQTRWGAHQLAYWINNYTAYRLSLGKIEHHFSAFDTLVLHDVTLAQHNEPAFLKVQRLAVTLSLGQLTKPYQFNHILLEDGFLSLASSPLAPAFPLAANNLQLSNMQIIQKQGAWPFDATQVYGRLFPWQPSPQHLLGDNARFQFSADQLSQHTLSARRLLIEGNITQQRLTLDNFGADIAQGQITGSLQQQPDGRWQVTQLNLSNLHWQTEQSLSQFIAPMNDLPPLEFKQVAITGAKFEGPDWAINNLNATLEGIRWVQGQWQSEKGTISCNADDIVFKQWHWKTPIINAGLSPSGIDIRQLSTVWENGLLSTTGQWRRDDQSLQLSNFSLTGLEYTLPQNWRELWQTPLPPWLSSVLIAHFNASRNLLVDVNPRFPFQFSVLGGFGQNLTLAKNHRWGILGGEIALNANNATLNKTDLSRLSLSLQADDNHINVNDLSALPQHGVLEATATFQQHDRQLKLDVEGQSVPANILHQWGWPKIPIADPVNMTLSLQGILDPAIAFGSQVNATLQVQTPNGQPLIQHMTKGAIAPPTVSP